MSATASLRHLSLEVSDIARTTWFYDRFLGELGFRRFVQETDYVAFTDGDLTIWLIKVRTPRIRRRPPTGDEEVVAEHLAFHVDSPERVAAIEAKLTKAELYPLFRGEEHPEFRPGYFSASWADPDQVVLEVYSIPAKRSKRSAGRSAQKPRAPAKKRRRA